MSLGIGIIASQRNKFLLDQYAGAAAAYSLRKLRSAYTGSAIRVRRSSDNTEEDIGFTSAGNLDESALATFVGANDGFVVTWYDQSSNGYNATQATAASQPRIVNAGTVETFGSRNALSFDGTDFMSADSVASTVTGEDKPFSLFALALIDTTNAVRQYFTFGRSTNANPRIDISRFRQTQKFDYNVRDDSNVISTTIGTFTYSSNTRYLLSTFSTGLNYKLYINDATLDINNNYNVGTLTLDRCTIGALGRNTTGEFFDGKISELVFYASDKSSINNAVNANINAYYSIY